MRILIDADGVLCDFLTSYLAAYNRLNARSCDLSDVTDFCLWKCLGTREEDNAVWRHIDRTPGFVLGLDWHPGAEDGLAQLIKLGHVVCVTSPHVGPTWMPERHEWLRERGFAKRDIVFATDKSLVRGDVLIDDKPENCEDWAIKNPDGCAILFDARYNQCPLVMRNIVRADGWSTVVEVVRALRRMRESNPFAGMESVP